MSESRPVGVIVLCGGTSRRFGGIDKTDQSLGAATVLDSLLTALPAGWPVVCVGTPRRVARPVTWTVEDPPRGGPVAGIAAGLGALTCADDKREAIVVVLAGDQPFVGGIAEELVRALATAPADVDGVAARGEDGEVQLLAAAYRCGPLAERLAGDVANRGVYATLAPLHVEPLTVARAATLDVDTPADLARAIDLSDRSPRG